MSESQANPKKTGNKKKQQSALNDGTVGVFGTASLIGLHLVSGIIVGTGLGYGIDRYFDIFPWCAGIGFFLGIVAGFQMMWRDAQLVIRETEKIQKMLAEDDAKKGEAGAGSSAKS